MIVLLGVKISFTYKVRFFRLKQGNMLVRFCVLLANPFVWVGLQINSFFFQAILRPFININVKDII